MICIFNSSIKFWSSTFAILGSFSFLLSACKEPAVIETSKEIVNAEKRIEDPHNYTRENLSKIGRGVMFSISRNEALKSLLYQEIEKQFDGDYNVLIETLEKTNSLFKLKNNIELANNSPMGRTSGDDVLKAFEGIEGNTYFPQVYIPFYENLKKKGKINKESPVLVAYDGITKEEEDGYVLNKKTRNFEKLPFRINEEYAKDHEVWVFSVNDRVDGNKEKSKSAAKLRAVESLYLERMNVKVAKEGWQSGKSDINIIAYCTNQNGEHPWYPGAFYVKTLNLYSGFGGQIDTWSRQYLGSMRFYGHKIWFVDDVSKKYEFGGNYTTDDLSHLYYVIYEQDNWPESIKTRRFNVGNHILEMGYRSAESHYIGDFIIAFPNYYGSNSGRTYLVDNNDITVDFKIRCVINGPEFFWPIS
ncbi:hypothetical protein [Larkinella soli]|uniref:hypothetical protein n=1 Tax=Larkinella soli TaxID=1770527 RepID=UPI000FFB9A50|nr:hypothetical protein [Larkinella soli]